MIPTIEKMKLPKKVDSVFCAVGSARSTLVERGVTFDVAEP